ncbi:gamma-glutamyl-gamma-aminobutyrate hydrolase family protein [Synechococcus sp. MVIR-18-1]|uniref:glutamine amidotransferase-related protein n=1 Tax=Synechococcus sp. MVIR-18-1 TaxID=1386941 RepID=UPI0021029DB5|nr:gamma-glutamyl-gamma-aminobutyrate hydrolase family protein [Synechococcus sp. MVIR-18-1]
MEWHRQRKPVIGICLGAQLLAVAAGGGHRCGPLGGRSKRRSLAAGAPRQRAGAALAWRPYSPT